MIKEQEPIEGVDYGNRSWESAETWRFIQNSICHDNKVYDEIVQSDKRNRYMSKMSRLRDQQMKLMKDAEKKRQLEERRQE